MDDTMMGGPMADDHSDAHGADQGTGSHDKTDMNDEEDDTAGGMSQDSHAGHDHGTDDHNHDHDHDHSTSLM